MYYDTDKMSYKNQKQDRKNKTCQLSDMTVPVASKSLGCIFFFKCKP